MPILDPMGIGALSWHSMRPAPAVGVAHGGVFEDPNRPAVIPDRLTLEPPHTHTHHHHRRHPNAHIGHLPQFRTFRMRMP